MIKKYKEPREKATYVLEGESPEISGYFMLKDS